MKLRLLISITAITLLAVVAIPNQPAAQNTLAGHHKYHHYKLVDLGTFGGPTSIITSFATLDINHRGTTVAKADTFLPDPYAPNCFQPNCLVDHTLQWKDGSRTDLGALPGINSSLPTWINRQGWVAGESENGVIDPLTGFPETEAVLWKEGQIISLGTLGGSTSWANQVNDRGKVVGGALNAIPDPFPGSSFFPNYFSFPVATQGHAFLWDAQEGMRDLGTIDDAGPDSVALFVNENTQVVGMSFTNSMPNSNNGPACVPNVPTQDPFLWENGKMTDLGTLGGDCGWPYAINNRGEVVGDSTPVGDADFLPFLWTKATRMQALPLAGGTDGEAFSINDAGQAVGYAGNPSINPPYAHVLLWEKGVARDLGVVGSDQCALGFAINSQGQVGGSSGSNATSCSDRALFWNGAGPLVDLNSLVTPKSNLQLYEVISINDRSEIIGNGFLPNGDNRGFLLIPCDGNHPGVEGCDYSMVDASMAARVSPAPTAQHPRASTPGSRMPMGMLNRLRFPWGKRNFGSRTGVVLDQKQEATADAVTTDWLGDHTLARCRGCGHGGECEADSNGRLTGNCVGHQLYFCDIQPSRDCPRGRRARRPSETTCGGLGTDRIDLARRCSF
jgi:uncharacterized membrane protein